MSKLIDEIKTLKDGRTMSTIKKEDIKLFYKLKGLSTKLSNERAETSGNFLNKTHLVEFKSLIIWTLKKRVDYKGYLDLKETMVTLLNKVESENIVYKSKRGIKGVIMKLTIDIGLDNVESNLRKKNGISILTNSYGNPLLEHFTQHKLDVLMN